MATAQEDSVRRYWHDVWSNGDLTGVSAFYAPSFRLNGEPTTTSDFRAGVERWRRHFEAFTVDVERVFTCEAAVVSRVIYHGIHVGDFDTVPATGRRVEVSGLDVFEFEGERVVAHWHETDHLEMFHQLGAEARPRLA